MAYENLKAAIKQAIKQNGNQEITGSLLQNTLLSIVNTIGAEYKFLGFANSSTVPPTSEEGRLLYFTTGHGDSYMNFPTSASGTYVTLEYGIYALTREANSKYWRSDVIVPIAQELGTALDKVMSQKAVNTELGKKANTADVDTKFTEEKNRVDGELGKKANTADVDAKFTEEKNRVDGELGKKFDKANIAQESGSAKDKVMSQKAVSDKLNDLVKSLKDNFSYKGIALPTTNPGVPDSNVFYIAGEGSYPNFGNQVVEVGQIAVLKWDGSWHKEVLEIGAGGGNMILEWNTDVATTRKQVLQKYRKAGIQISYKNGEGDWVNEQYIGTSPSDQQWGSDSNWKVVDDKCFFVEWNTDVATTRKQLFTSFRKKGSILTYTHPTYGIISEIYIGQRPDLEDYWVQDKYWFRLSNYYFQVVEWNTDKATTRKSIPFELRKTGMVLMYENPTKAGNKDFIIEQYVGRIVASNDAIWSSDENWVRINSAPVLNREFQTYDFAICDEKGNIIVMFKDGHIKTKNFDSNSQVFKDLSFIADMPTTDICLESFNSYVGDTIQLFKYPVSLIRNYRDFVVNIAPFENKNATFRNLERYAEIQPKSTGTIKMKVQLLSNMGRLGVSKDFLINVLQPQNPSSVKNVLVIGDSEVQGITNNTNQSAVNTDRRDYPFTTELKGLLSNREGDDVTPAGLNLSNIKLIGSRNTELGRHDGIGGWTADLFLTSTQSPFYVNGQFNFTSYLDQDKIYDDVLHKGVDIMYVLLGANNDIKQTATANGWTYDTSGYKAQMIRLLDFIKTDILTEGKKYYNPNFKLILLNYAFPWLYGNSYHPYGVKIYGDGTKNARMFYQIHLANKELASMENYRSFVSAVLIAPFVDSENCYAAIEKPINKRMTTKELIIVENVHPIKEGYQLYAEGVLRDLIGRI